MKFNSTHNYAALTKLEICGIFFCLKEMNGLLNLDSDRHSWRKPSEYRRVGLYQEHLFAIERADTVSAKHIYLLLSQPCVMSVLIIRLKDCQRARRWNSKDCTINWKTRGHFQGACSTGYWSGYKPWPYRFQYGDPWYLWRSFVYMQFFRISYSVSRENR